MKTDRFGFYILDEEEELDYTSTDNDDGDLDTRDRKTWWEEDDCRYDDDYEEEEDY